MPSSHPFHTVDAFTSRPFSGNPAAVLVFSDSEEDQRRAGDDDKNQLVAAEFNLAETAFARKIPGEGSDEEPVYELRWRTPTVEVPLCGHATLATAHVLFSTTHPTATTIRFPTRQSGELRATKSTSSSGDELISLDFPAGDILTLEDGHRRRPKVVEAVRKATRLEEDAIKRVAWYDAWDAAVVELDSTVGLEALDVKVSELASYAKLTILTQPAPANSGFDIYSRVFAPAVGIDEDPVTGAAHTALTPFWLSPASLPRLSATLSAKDAKKHRTLRAKQVSRRGGEIECVLSEDGKRAELRGRARTVMRGEIELE
ncbi:hypothetical protein JCM8097_001708 [Rhodosporidiobolus ruineniae]